MLTLSNDKYTKLVHLKSNYYIAFTTCPNSDIANHLAQEVIEQQLVACVNIIPTIHSIYKWQGEITQDSESLLIMKTQQQHLAALESFIQKQHPYDVPEFITISIESGSKAYLDWITASLDKNANKMV